MAGAPRHHTVPFTPGSSSDIVTRALSVPMQQSLGKQMVVENRPGATGKISAHVVIRAPRRLRPDARAHLHLGHQSRPRPNLGYDAVTRLTAISQTVRTPNVLVVNPNSVPADNLRGIVAWLKRPGARASYSFPGIGSSDHLTVEMFKQRTGTEVAHVPCVGGAPATTDLISGTVEMSFQNLGSIAPHILCARRTG